MVTTAMIRSLSVVISVLQENVRCFIPHPSNEGSGQHPASCGDRVNTGLFLPYPRKQRLRRA